MKAFVESIDKELEVDIENIDRLKGLDIREDKIGLFVHTERHDIPLEVYLGLVDDSNEPEFKNGNKYDYRKDNVSIKPTSTEKYTGVVYIKSQIRLKARYQAYYPEDGKNKMIGYYYSARDAAIVREYLRVSQNKDWTPTGINMSLEELKREYDEIIFLTETTKALNREQSLQKVHIAKNQNNLMSGIRVNKNSTSLTLRINKERVYLGKFNTLNDTLIYRNAYIIKNNLTLPLVNIGLTNEETLAKAKDIVPDLERGGYSKQTKQINVTSKYVGVSYVTKSGLYRVDCIDRIRKKKMYVLSSRDEQIAGIAYNIFSIDRAGATEIINDVGMTIDEQRARLINYYSANGRRMPAAFDYMNITVD